MPDEMLRVAFFPVIPAQLCMNWCGSFSAVHENHAQQNHAVSMSTAQMNRWNAQTDPLGPDQRSKKSGAFPIPVSDLCGFRYQIREGGAAVQKVIQSQSFPA